MDLLKILLIITLLSIPTGEMLRIQLTREIGINFIDIAVGVTGFYGIFYLLKNKISISRIELYFLAFIAVGIISLIINFKNVSNDQFFISALYPLRLLFLFMILPLIRIQDKKFKKKLEAILILDGLIIVIEGIMQFFLYPSLRNLYYLGWDEHLYRLFSTFLDPNFTGVFLILFIVLLIPKARKNLRFGSLAISLSIAALVLTYSRAALLSFSLVAFLFLFLNKRKYIPIFILILGSVLLVQANTIRSEGTNLFRTTSTFARIGSFGLAVDIFKAHPILGVGFNSYRYASNKYLNPPLKKESLFPSHGQSAPDNSFLFVLATAGIIGFILYLSFWRILIIKYLRNLRSFDSQVIIFSIIVLFVSSFFVNALFYTPILLWFFSVLGIRENNSA